MIDPIWHGSSGSFCQRSREGACKDLSLIARGQKVHSTTDLLTVLEIRCRLGIPIKAPSLLMEKYRQLTKRGNTVKTFLPPEASKKTTNGLPLTQ